MKRILLLMLFCSLLAAKEKKHELSVCAIFKNEANFLKEWIEYHKLIGVDHFYLYNLGSVDSFKKVLNPYIKAKEVTLIPWNDLTSLSMQSELLWVLSTQIPAYENAAKWKAIQDTKWLIFLDVDEFLVPCCEGNLKDLLKRHEKDPAIILSVEHYDASNKGTLPQRKLVVESTDLIDKPPLKMKRAVEKSIFKPDLCKSITWPPYHYEFKGDKKGTKVGKELIRINRYENRMQFLLPEKVARKMDGAALTENEKAELLKSGYQVDDCEKAIFRFLPELFKKMGIERVVEIP